ncbi:IS1182 family transposase [Myroides odoratimimus]|nr:MULTISPECIES: IS1182 family transposase [Myroides]MCO7724622.1 IS1182 family transposase [Myroides odoratimimus]MDM1412517.1 IS1182 family transposase [Myroides odoratimimus]MDM1444928.1 IS1182 family transposase [Myroides odoratimimus]MDM1450981.1 IS1182 family transposase [Myroides odoratimimus]MDM1455010.1 IS1182 family transposase [Myroides odoratimimus]
MVSHQETISFSKYSELYDMLVPKDNMLRQINNLVDFTFVYQELSSKYCVTNGRMAYSPIRLFKYLLLKTIFDISDQDVVERSQYDLSFKYFLDMSIEEKVIEASTLSKFRKLRLQDTDMLNLLIGKTVELAIAKGIIKSEAIILDATHTKSRSNAVSVIEFLRYRSKNVRKVLYETDPTVKDHLPTKNTDDNVENEMAYCTELINYLEDKGSLSSLPKVSEKLNVLKEALDDVKEQRDISKDQDARIGHKSKEESFLGYKTHIAMSKERVITAAVVTSGEKGDGPLLTTLVEESIKNGMTVNTVIGDRAYSSKDNLIYAKKNNISVISKLNPVISQGTRKKEDQFDFNKDADMFVCPAGHLAVRKATQGKKGENTNQVKTYYFDVEKCKQCPLKDGCYKPGAKTKSYSVSISSQTHLDQLAFEDTPEFKEEAKHRYKIEAKNAELKNAHGYDTALSYGLSSMQMQGALAIFAVNLKRILKLM